MEIKVFKIGGQIVDDADQLQQFITILSKIKGKKILIHGGGKIASQLCMDLGIVPKMHNGRRITDQATLKVVVMAYAGWINKSIVAQLQSEGLNALGLTGADSNLILAHKRQNSAIDYGFAGDIDKVDASVLETILIRDQTPVIAPITHDGKGQLLNTNADTIANEIAVSLAHEHSVDLYYLFDKKGVLVNKEDEHSLISEIKISEINDLIDKSIIVDGMIPKIQNAKAAVENGVAKIILTNVAELQKSLNHQTVGTTIRK